MVPKQYLTGFTPTVSVSGGTYVVDYEIGECVYTRYTSRSTDTYQKMGPTMASEPLVWDDEDIK